MYQALYRTFSTKKFSDVVDQDAIVKTLLHQVSTGRIAHAYLFCGTRGTGKTSMARLFARAINCHAPQNGEACGECPACLTSTHENMDINEIDAASNNGVDEIRDLRDKVRYPPAQGRYKVYIIDEVHMLSTGAFNALLKTLEEPPAHAVFILATTEPHKLPATILSRCQRFDVRRLSVEGIVGRLRVAAEAAQVKADDAALMAVARSAEGSMRDAYSILDVCLSYGENPITLKTVQDVLGSAGQEACHETADALICGDAAQTLRLIDRIVREGRDPSVFLRDFTAYLRSLLVALTVTDCADLLAVTDEEAADMRKQALQAGPERLQYWLSLLAKTEGGLRWATQPRLLVEVCLVRACKPETDDDAEALRARISKLEEAVARGVAAPAAAPVAVAESSRERTRPAAERAHKLAAAPGAAADSPVSTPQGLWKQALAAVKAEHGMSKYVLVQKAIPVKLDDIALHLLFSTADKIFHTSAIKEENQRIVDAILTRIAGKPLSAAYTLGDAPSSATSAPASAVQKAIDLFGRDIVSVEQPE